MSAPYPPQVTRKYSRPRRFFSIAGILIGFCIGLGGAFFFTQRISPLEEVNIEPWQMNRQDRAQYMVAIALAFAYDSDANAAVERLLNLRLTGDPIQAMAQTACGLATSGFVNSTSGLNAVRAMMNFYQLQGRTDCADVLITNSGSAPTAVAAIQPPLPTITLTAPATKSPTPDGAVFGTPTPVEIIIPTTPPQSDFELLRVDNFCAAESAGQIQVMVYELNGATGIPGQAIRVRWNGGESTFFTGLKSEFDAGYADFTMQDGQNYIVDMPGRSDPLQEPLRPVPCSAEDGERTVITYRVIFRAIG